MFVRMKQGARAGEVQEVPFVTGKTLVDEDRAEQAFFDGRETGEVQPVTAPAAAPKAAAKQAKRKR